MNPQIRTRFFEVLEVRRLLSVNPITTTITPRELESAYGLNDVTFGRVGNAATQFGGARTIAVVEFGDDINFVNTSDNSATTQYPITYANSDLSLFDNEFDLAFEFNFSVVGETGGARPNFKMNPSANPVDPYQTALDVEWAHAMAPGANIVLIEVTSFADSDFLTAVTAGVQATGASVVVLSGYGGFQNNTGNKGVQTFQEGILNPSVFAQPGVTFVDASGDSGTPGLALGDYPDIVDVASSDVTLNNDGGNYAGSTRASWNNDTGWSNPPPGPGFDTGGSGGGYTDDIFPTPSYQQGLVISDGNQTVSSFGERTTPDVSFPGGNNSLPYVSGGKDLNTSDEDGAEGVDGTEVAADAFAGVVELVDQGLLYDGDPSLSSVQTLTGLYAAPSYDFHDITSGFNGNSAGVGYDLVSGLGTPIANQLVPDIAKYATTEKNTVWSGLNYSAPETWATGATAPNPNNIVLKLGTLNGVSTIEITDNGVLTASDPLASTSEININCGDFAQNSLTVDFSGGNMIPLGGLSFDGTSVNGGTVGVVTLTIQGQLPAITGTIPTNAGQLASGVWSTEVQRPLSPTSGIIALGGVYNINYSNITQNIVDTTPATSVTYTALGSNTDDVLLTVGPTINGVKSTQFSSSGANVFVPVDFINKTGVTATDSDGNDTLILNFNNGNPLPPSGLTFNGGTGTNYVQVAGNGNFTLGTNATITNTTIGGGGLSLLNENSVLVTGGPGDQYFTVTNWLTSTGQPLPLTINGGGGHDQIYIRQSSNFYVNDSYITSDAGLELTMIAISYLELYNSNTGGSFTVNNWTSSDGLGLYLIGSAGNNNFVIGNSTSSTGLDAITAPVTVMATGGRNNTITLNDQGSSTFVNYALTQNSITSVLDGTSPFPGGNRPFKGISIANFTASTPTAIQQVNLYANKQGSTFTVTPNTTTAYNLVGTPSPPTTLSLNNLIFTNPTINSPTLFVTSGPTFVQSVTTPLVNNTGLFMFSGGIKGVNFSNMQTTNYTGSVGAINAVSATAGPASKPMVNIINSMTGQILQTISLGIYPPSYAGGIQVAVGDVTGDGIPDLIVAPGVGETPLVGVYNIVNGALYQSFLAQSPNYNYGLRVAVGDVTGDGKEDLVTAPLVGPAILNVFTCNGTNSPFTAYSASTPVINAFSNIAGYQGGVGGIAIGNVTNNPATANDPGGVGNIIVGTGSGTPSVAQVYNYKATGSTLATTIIPSFSAMVTGGISVAVADVTGDGIPDLVMGAGTGAASQVDIWSGAATHPQNQFTAFTGSGSTAALHVAIAKINGVNDILVAQNTGGLSHQLKTFTNTGAAVGVAFAQTQSWLQSGINLD